MGKIIQMILMVGRNIKDKRWDIALFVVCFISVRIVGIFIWYFIRRYLKQQQNRLNLQLFALEESQRSG